MGQDMYSGGPLRAYILTAPEYIEPQSEHEHPGPPNGSKMGPIWRSVGSYSRPVRSSLGQTDPGCEILVPDLTTCNSMEQNMYSGGPLAS